MTRSIPKLARVLAAVAAFSLIIAACGDGGEEPAADETTATDAGTESPTDGGTETGDAAAGPSGSISSYLGEPESLITLNDNESEGIAVLRAIYSMLIGYDVQTSEPFNLVAESIESEDEGKTWTITLKDGWTFHNGDPVTAESFVRAWNYGAYGPNAMQNSGFFADIEGFDEVNPSPAEGETEAPEPTAEEMSGLSVVDDLTFEVTLSEAQSFWNTKLGYPAYAPLPEAFYEDPEGFNEQPIGNGPFQMADAWQHNQSITLQAFEDYAGDNKPKVEEIEFRIYDDVNTAINDLLAGNLDIVDAIPAERSPEIEQQFADRFAESPSSSINYLAFPSYHEQLSNPDLRAALSMAIDRQAITETIFNGSRQPANALVAPVIPGYQEQPCENWTYNPEAAQAAYEASGGWEGTMTVWFNAGAGHENWVEAVTNMWRETLGIEDFQFESLQFAEYLGVLDNQEATGPFRLGWGMDYPHPQNYLQLLLHSDFAPPIGANSSFFSNEEFDAKLEEALTITDLEEAIPVYQEAQTIACEATPLAPMFFGLNQYAWNEPVENLFVDAFGDINYTEVSVASS